MPLKQTLLHRGWPRTNVVVQNNEHYCPHVIQNQLLEVLRNSVYEARLIRALLFRKVKFILPAVCRDAGERCRCHWSKQGVYVLQQIFTVCEGRMASGRDILP
jgi:hypothetical protein